MKNYHVKIGWLYPDLMSTYGDRGNIFALRQRCEWRGISVTIVPIHQETQIHEIATIDLLFGGGSQDREQEIVMRDLRGKKQKTLMNRIEAEIPALFVCGSPQLMGNYYEPAVGQRIEGIGIFDMITTNPGPDTPRCIGNVVAKIEWENLFQNVIASPNIIGTKQSPITNGIAASMTPRNDNLIVGFENHGGRTYLGKKVKPFAKMIKGYGNNGNDGTEGVVYKNAIGCYFHGPLLPKNPHIADFLIQRALEVKYNMTVNLDILDDTLENDARQMIVKRLGLSV